MCDGESGRSPKRVSGRLRFRHHFSFPLSTGFGRVACACRGGASAPSLSYQDKHTPRLQETELCRNNSLEVSDISVFLFEISFLLVEISAKQWYNIKNLDEVEAMVSYVKLWKKLIDLGMKKKDLKEETGIGSTTLTKLNNNEIVSMAVMIKICEALHCNIGEVMDIIYE